MLLLFVVMYCWFVLRGRPRPAVSRGRFDLCCQESKGALQRLALKRGAPVGRYTYTLNIQLHCYMFKQWILQGILLVGACARQWVFGSICKRGEDTVDWDTVALSCSTGNCLSNFNKRISSKSSKQMSSQKLELRHLSSQKLELRNLSSMRVSNRIFPPSETYQNWLYCMWTPMRVFGSVWVSWGPRRRGRPTRRRKAPWREAARFRCRSPYAVSHFWRRNRRLQYSSQSRQNEDFGISPPWLKKT